MEHQRSGVVDRVVGAVPVGKPRALELLRTEANQVGHLRTRGRRRAERIGISHVAAGRCGIIAPQSPYGPLASHLHHGRTPLADRHPRNCSVRGGTAYSPARCCLHASRLPQTERATVLPDARPLPALALTNQDGGPLGHGFLQGRLDDRLLRLHDLPGHLPHHARDAFDSHEAAVRPAARRSSPASCWSPSTRSATTRRSSRHTCASSTRRSWARRATQVRRRPRPRRSGFRSPASSLPEGGYTMDHGSGCSSSRRPEQSPRIRPRRTMPPCWRGITARSSPQPGRADDEPG